MFRTILFLIAALSVAIGHGQIPASFVANSEEYRAQAEKEFKAAAKTMKGVLAVVKKGVVRKEVTTTEVVNNKLVYPSQDEKDSRIEFVTRSIKSVEDMGKKSGTQYPLPPLDLTKGEFGRVGYLHRYIVVTQVMSRTSFRGEVVMSDGTRYEAWMEGMDTTGLVDDKMYLSTRWNDGIYQRDGSTTYTTVLGGTRTLPVIRSVPASSVEKVLPDGGELLYMTHEQVKILRSAFGQ